jgi:hypothetical protein
MQMVPNASTSLTNNKHTCTLLKWNKYYINLKNDAYYLHPKLQNLVPFPFVCNFLCYIRLLVLHLVKHNPIVQIQYSKMVPGKNIEQQYLECTILKF